MFTDVEGTPDEYFISSKLKEYGVADIYQSLKLKHLLENKLAPN